MRGSQLIWTSWLLYCPPAATLKAALTLVGLLFDLLSFSRGDLSPGCCLHLTESSWFLAGSRKCFNLKVQTDEKTHSCPDTRGTLLLTHCCSHTAAHIPVQELSAGPTGVKDCGDYRSHAEAHIRARKHALPHGPPPHCHDSGFFHTERTTKNSILKL